MANIEKYIDNITVPSGNDTVTNHLVDTVSGYIKGSQVPSNETDPTVPSWAKASTKPSYTASEVGALPDDTFIPTKTSDLINDSDFMSGMTILSYGHSTWQDFITAYTKKHVVYCRASSQSNPATGSQTRLAFMAYVNNADNPTEVEFQYYRSVSTHTASQQGDQVYVYKLTSAGTWTVTVREASVKVAAGTGIDGKYSNGTMTLSLNGTLPTKTSDLTNDSGFITGAQVPSNETDPTVPAWAKSASKPSYSASEVGAPELFEIQILSEGSNPGEYVVDYGADEIFNALLQGSYCYIYDDTNAYASFPFVGYGPAQDSFLFESLTVANGALHIYGYEMPLTGGDASTTIVVFREETVPFPEPPSAGTTATAVSTTASGGSASTWSKSDHVHSISSSTITTALGYTPYNSTNPSGYITASDVPSAGTSATAVGTTASGGSATTWSKSDHVHSINSTTIISALGYTPYNNTNPSGFITLNDVPEEVVNTEFIPSETPIAQWVSGNWQISVTGSIGLDAQIEFKKITTGNHVEYPGHRFPISIPAVGAGVGKMFAVSMSTGYFGAAMGAQLKDSADTNLIALYSTTHPTEASISSSVMSSATGITLLITGDTNNTVPVGTTCTFNNIRIYNTSTSETLWTLSYKDAVEFTDGSSSVPFTDLKQALTNGKVLQLYDNNLCYSYLGDTNNTIVFGKIDEDVYKQYIVTSDDSISIQETSLQTTNNLVTTISSSSTDSEYPSAKCVYDIIGNIESLLASI